MKARIKHYLGIYQGFISTSFAESLNFRVHFVLLILMDFFFYGSSFLSIHFIYQHVEVIGTWHRNELMFFVSFMLSVNQLAMTFTSESYWRFPELIKRGELDFVLLKPANSIFLVFFRYIRPGSAFNIIFTLPALIYFGIQLGLGVTAWVMLPFLVAVAFLLQSAIDVILATTMFWMLEGTGMNFLRIELQQLSRWPDFIYPDIFRKFLSLGLPVLLIGSGPVRFLLEASDFIPLLVMLALLVLFLIFLSFLWKKGLRAYESASS
ncbi:MAG: ABC-2 family transporter protein [SAR324 cluster bacterium]|nr:ABC-2 family transporter protein [SAR324 cluster bacterium]